MNSLDKEKINHTLCGFDMALTGYVQDNKELAQSDTRDFVILSLYMNLVKKVMEIIEND